MLAGRNYGGIASFGFGKPMRTVMVREKILTTTVSSFGSHSANVSTSWLFYAPKTQDTFNNSNRPLGNDVER